MKTDKLDSKILAHLLRADLIAECYVPSKDVSVQGTAKPQSKHNTGAD